jgi:hypothetical protein
MMPTPTPNPFRGFNITAPPPRLISSLTAGFNLVANHIAVILFPILLDLLLWFAPRLRVNELLTPVLNSWLQDLALNNPPDLIQSVNVAQQNLQQVLNQSNLFYSLSGFPIGIPSLITSSGFMENPGGFPVIYEATSAVVAILGWIILSLVGIVLGSLYFGSISRLSAKEPQPFSLHTTAHQASQSILLVICLFVIVIALAVPLFFLASVLVMIAPSLAQFSLTLVFIIVFWLAVPLYFCGHGIFVFQQTALNSFVTSRRLVRAFMPAVTLFILVNIFLTYGLNLLWLSAPANSWMCLVGIAGHAFISSGLLAASFVFYRLGIQWLQEYMKAVAGLQSHPTPPVTN